MLYNQQVETSDVPEVPEGEEEVEENPNKDLDEQELKWTR